MKNFYVYLLVLLPGCVFGQYSSALSTMNWEYDSQIMMKLENDSTYSFDIRQLFHVNDISDDMFNTEFVYYPVDLGDDYIKDVKGYMPEEPRNPDKPWTLWSSLHHNLGGGWVHFTNCLLYALEKEQLSLTAPLMKRPESNWKPKPPTETYLRTKKWEYYAPVDQKYAIKEYKIRKEKHQLADLQSIPPTFINLFLNTNRREYKKIEEAGKTHELAKIDLVKLLLGANYLGEAQITYVSSSVLSAVKSYTVKNVPSVIVFDELDAAVAMKLDKEGYKIQEVVFRGGAQLTAFEAQKRTEEIKEIISKINIYNNQAFQKRLKTYYAR